MFACEHEGVAPDLLCLAKGLTGGYLPLAATLATDEIWQAFLGTYAESKTFFHGHTYGGNPLGAAAALATLDVFEEEQTLEQLAAEDRPARPSIWRGSPQLPHVGDVRQCGLIAAHRTGPRQGDQGAVSLGRATRACASATTPGAKASGSARWAT